MTHHALTIVTGAIVYSRSRSAESTGFRAMAATTIVAPVEAMMKQSFFATIKAELISRRLWASQRQLRAAVFDYIETFYNRERLHSTLGYRTPAQVEANYINQRAA